jgi:Alpha-glutamyl/putrescinyl thymine pyrophosphorylase clade 3
VRALGIDSALARFELEVGLLPGIHDKVSRRVLIEQIVESLRRVEYAHFVRDHKVPPDRADPTSAIFDPIRASVFRMRGGEIDEAFWLVFLSVHFGKHSKEGWRLARDVYGALGGVPWTWARVSSDPSGFRQWLDAHRVTLKARRFSNHRKYQSLSGSSVTGTGATVASYVQWVAPPRTHSQLLQDAHKKVGQNPHATFDYMYRSMDEVIGFGRLGKFDFLTMLGKLGIAPIDPGSAYLTGATGPLNGARLLFGGTPSAKFNARDLNARLVQLDAYLNVGMQVLEDSLCNWQKSPRKFVSFRG